MRRPLVALLVSVAIVPVAVASVGGAVAASGPTYRADDYADGQAMSILPPGENGLVTAAQALSTEAGGARAPHSQDDLDKYGNLLYGSPTVTNATLSQYFDDESFGVKPADVIRSENPEPGVTIYRDARDVPHVYGDSDATMAFGAGYAQAEDRLFFMDVLRHYGEGTLSSFLGPSCDFEQMDHDQLLIAPYTQAQAQAQLDALPGEYGSDGQAAKDLITSYVAGVNAWIDAALLDPANKLDADYAAAVQNAVPTHWKPTDVVAIAALIGGLLGKGGGDEVHNATARSYLQGKYGAAGGAQAFADLKQDEDPLAPSTLESGTFPYEHPTKVDPAKTAIPDSATLTGGPTATTANCDLTKPNAAALNVMQGIRALPHDMSNAIVVAGSHTDDGHPIAVFGPQTSYFAPEILMEEDLHSPHYAAEGASFPGTGLVELGRGEDFAWSATTPSVDVIDQRVEKICNPSGGAPAANGTYYLLNGQCVPMTHETFDEGVTITKPGGVGAPAVVNHDIYLTQDGGIVQGWTTVGGQPVAIASQRSTFNHDIDSVIGFLRWGDPDLTYDAKSWQKGAADIGFVFNWFYADDRDIAYFLSGRDPLRRSDVDPDLPTWGTGGAEWTGFLSAAGHPQAINPPNGYLVSWNNKSAHGFSAADDERSFGPVYRALLLINGLKATFKAHPKVSRAQVVKVMENAASQDLDGQTVLPQLLAYLGNRAEPPGVTAMLAQLRSWLADGTHRKKAKPGDAQYAHAAAVAIMDDLSPALARAFFEPIFGTATKAWPTPALGFDEGFATFPLYFQNTPNNGGFHLGSAFDGGYESYLVRVFEELRGQKPKDAFRATITSHLCGTGPTACRGAVDTALANTYNALVAANGGSTDVASWTASVESKAGNQAMPVFDALVFRPIGLIAQPNLDWQNRPTFQQVVQFPRHRPRVGGKPATKPAGGRPGRVTRPSGSLAATGLAGGAAAAALALTTAGLAVGARRRRRARAG
ncbi:MAG TPA: penicillin acylase family protein [Mycobacteriales bacterium]|nr:penicillin acylase family protein [Mycobacteriales bacterium]